MTERKESSGITTQYDPTARTMNLLDKTGKSLEEKFDQTMIDYPTRLVLEIASFCSSNCRYCSEGSTKSRIKLPKEKIFDILNEAEERRVHEVTIRGGEATEHPDFYEIWKFANEKEFISPNVISNGMTFDIEKVRDLLANPNSKAIVSLDGFEEINSFHRNPLQYKLLMSWLPKAIEEHPEQIVVLSCLYRQNYEQIFDFAKHLANMGLRHYHLPPLKRLGRSEMADDNFVSLDEINILQDYLDELGCEFPGFKPVVSCTALKKYKNNKTMNIPVPLFNEMYYGTGMKITPEGNVMVNRGIMFTDRFKRGVNSEISLEPLGNLYTDRDIGTIWSRSQDLRVEQGKLADEHYKYYLGWLKSLNTK